MTFLLLVIIDFNILNMFAIYIYVCVCVCAMLVMWLECWFPDTEVDGSNPGVSMLCP